MLSCSDSENGVGQFVVRHSAQSILDDIGERCEAGISLGLMVIRIRAEYQQLRGTALRTADRPNISISPLV
jgi:hypothetical protein